MNTDVLTRDFTPEAGHAEQHDPLAEYIEAATLSPRLLRLKELPEKREAALEELERRYGGFSPTTARQIADPIHRFIMLGEMAGKAWGKSRRMDKLRTQRSTAIQILRYDYDYKPMEIVRHIEADDRRVVDSAILSGDKTQRPNWTEQRARDVARRMHKEYVQAVDYGDESRPDRDRLILELSEGRWDQREDGTWKRLTDTDMARRRNAGKPVGRIWSNAELHRLGYMSSAAVAQIRTHTAPSQRRAA